ncbi:RcnB family protein [Sphingomonas sp. MG17]|uniref:RcnB family protein n=1 Tax=Sphingomonas tagetis TaxID=2949092 RepID=A0A9X2HVZ8_9SPHN|nr:RcnB family protein [Sphingomonas tagetis]MCP3733035.1 RcnB family protein [Sphingomonas tagetis]
MKKFVLAAVATTLVASPILAAAPAAAAPQRYEMTQRSGYGDRYGDNRFERDRRYQPTRSQYRNWKRGERFDSRYARNYRQVDYRQYRGLRAPPRGYRYVQSGNDAVLIGITSGIIAAVFAGMIR